LDNLDQSFLLAVFDTGYAFGGQVDYVQGIAFAEHVFEIANRFSDVMIAFKEKQNRRTHQILDHNLGPKLLELYQRIESHPQIMFLPYDADTSMIMSASDMVISAPFTSTTFEFLSVNRPAVWHDPMGVHRNKPFAKYWDAMTHDYDELEKKVLRIKKLKPDDYQNPFPSDSPLMDPYRDGKAIERFRKLLCA
jgi:polysaccharide biosynthesis PFTS motif protein